LDKISAKQIDKQLRQKQQKEEKKRREELIAIHEEQLRGARPRTGIDLESPYLSDVPPSSVVSISSLDEELYKLDRKIEGINAKADREALDKPNEKAKVEYKRQRELLKLGEKKERLYRKRDSKILKAETEQAKQDEKRAGRRDKEVEKREKAMAKDEKKANSMEFIVIECL
jgi:hypothetical protein